MSFPTEQELLELQETLYTSKNPTRRWLHQTRKSWILEQIRCTAAPTNALEVGPGSGIYLTEIAKISQHVVAADVEQAYLKRAEELKATIPHLTCRRDDITRSNLPENHFDLVLCTEVIEHIPDPQAALHGLFRVLAPGGTLILSTPQKYSLLELASKVAFLPGFLQLARLVYREPVLPTGHISLLTEDELRAQIRAAGFAEVRSHKSGLYIPGVAEGLGQAGLALEKWCERNIAATRLSFVLWTQYYVLTKPRPEAEGNSPASAHE